MFLGENVRGLATMAEGAVLDEVRRELEALGYAKAIRKSDQERSLTAVWVRAAHRDEHAPVAQPLHRAAVPVVLVVRRDALPVHR